MQNNTKKIEVKFTTDNGKLIEGVFICRYPTIGDRLSIGRLTAELEGNSKDNEFKFLCERLATIEILCEQKPEWWDLYNMPLDYLEAVNYVYLEIINFIEIFFSKTKIIRNNFSSEKLEK